VAERSFIKFYIQIIKIEYIRYYCISKNMMNFVKDKDKRGFVAAGDEMGYLLKTNDELLELLKSQVAIERTIGARVLGHRGHEFAEFLFTALESEQKLYPRIEICNALTKFGAYSVNGLVKRLGKIGKNQHRIPAIEPFKKKSYPLPRDIAARTLIRIGPIALPALCEVLKADNPSEISEAIDAIGFICYPGGQYNYLKPLMDCYNTFKSNDLVRWKIIRAMSAFPASRKFLEIQLPFESNPAIKQEIERSIRLIGRDK
jgi:HEAT repeat protein